MNYGHAPLDLGVHELDLPEHMSYLYLPVRMPEESINGVRLPKNLACIKNVVRGIMELYADDDEYIYVTAKRGYGIQSRPGWHSDGFGTDDRNVLWCRGEQTEFAVGNFGEVPTSHAEAMAHFTTKCEYDYSIHKSTFPDQTLVLMDQYNVHRPPEAQKKYSLEPAPALPRQFVKISISKMRYNLEGNSHNYLFDYDWKMYDRDSVRNMEHYEETDFIDPRMLP